MSVNMPEAASVKNKRIAKNTLLLYVRTFFTMCVSLFTSRLTLEALGVDNFGIYNVVGGLVGMFSIISGSITGSISRYLTYGIGKGDIEKLKVLFSTSVNVLLILSGIIILLGETIGIWFLTHKLNIPENQMYAAHWVLQCSLLAFVLGLISIPYNAAIVAHEKMNVFAYMTILDVLFRLGIVYTLFVTPFDRLITYSVFLVCVGLIMRLIYGIYCTRHFAECHYERVFDKGIFKDMSSFAGWTFLGNTSYLLNTQGVNMIINVFFGVALNAARGIVTQVEGAVMTLVNNFTTAFTPQITKSYAEGNMSYVHSLVCRGTKFSIFLLLFIIVPLIIEAPVVLSLWLKEVPPYTATFLRLSLCCNALLLMGNASLTAINATGIIKRYQISVTIVGCLVFPFTWLAYHFDAPPQTTYIIFLFIYGILLWIRTYYLKKLINLSVMTFIRSALLPIVFVSVAALPIPIVVSNLLDNGFLQLLCVTSASIFSTGCAILFIGLDLAERRRVIDKMQIIFKKFKVS